jgi:hypothetical protein
VIKGNKRYNRVHAWCRTVAAALPQSAKPPRAVARSPLSTQNVTYRDMTYMINFVQTQHISGIQQVDRQPRDVPIVHTDCTLLHKDSSERK